MKELEKKFFNAIKSNNINEVGQLLIENRELVK